LNCNIFLPREADNPVCRRSEFRVYAVRGEAHSLRLKAELQTRTETRLSAPQLHSILDVRRLAFDVFSCAKGRVAESGLRHSTRNGAWGNPPWVRIPPLPPVSSELLRFVAKEIGIQHDHF